MEEIFRKFLLDAVTILGGVALAYLSFYSAKAKAKLDIEIDQITDDEQRKIVKSAESRLNDLVIKGVNAAQQTLVIDLKKQIELGTASKSDLLKIGQDVANTVYDQLSTDAILALQCEINDIKGYIVNTVEAQVLKLKIPVSQPMVVPVQAPSESIAEYKVDPSANVTVQANVITGVVKSEEESSSIVQSADGIQIGFN